MTKIVGPPSRPADRGSWTVDYQNRWCCLVPCLVSAVNAFHRSFLSPALHRSSHTPHLASLCPPTCPCLPPLRSVYRPHMTITSDTRKPYSGNTRSLVLAFDVGTTFSGVSYAILEPNEIPKIHCVTRSVLSSHPVAFAHASHSHFPAFPDRNMWPVATKYPPSCITTRMAT